MRAKRLKRAWVVRWRESNEDEAAVAAHRIYVLSARMGAVRVIEFMRALFVNCPTLPLNDRSRFMKRGFDWRSITSNSGSNIVIGESPWIWAWYVTDFEAEWDESKGGHIFRWTRQPGFRFDAENQKIEMMGSESRVEVRVFNGPVNV